MRLKTEFVVIPAGMTSVLQPMDVSLNKPVKDGETFVRRVDKRTQSAEDAYRKNKASIANDGREVG